MRALMLASVASMLDQFNRENIALLERLGYQVDIACNFEEGNTSSKEQVAAFRRQMEEEGIETVQIPIPRNISAVGKILKSYQMVKKLVEDNQYDIVHCHSPI
ncbi:MAG: glycosyltransferase family 4 protein, partial [Lachnospiraceae bacterium]|nr:glycosyltransferase family 4 protein [Lachnospiraceae bacterium]